MASITENPWARLPLCPDYLVPDDESAVRNFNRTAAPHKFLHLDLLPEPFLGNPNAPVILLNLNPGFDPEDADHHKQNNFIERSRDNLIHRPANYPFFLLDPEITAPGNRWWSRRLRPLIDRCDLQTVAARVFCVEFFPYHSQKFAHDRLMLPSQQYSFSLVRNAVSRGAIIISMRKVDRWLRNVPELVGYRRLYEIGNPQSPYISPANFPESFGEICKGLISC